MTRRAELPKFLVCYYGALQSLHLLFLLLVIFGDTPMILKLVSPGLVGKVGGAMMISTYMDLLVSIPFGLLFVYGFINSKPWWRALAAVSLNFAMASAFVYFYVLLVFDVWEFSLGNSLILLFFSPLIALYGFWLGSFKGK